MSGRTVTQFILTCDGCGVEQPMLPTSTEARGKAYADGWRFPPQQTKKSGRASKRSVFDVCPTCLPNWGDGLR